MAVKKKSLSTFESLETRLLLAADLAVQLEGPSTLVPGQPSSYTMRVDNYGPDDVDDVQTLNQATHLLDEVTWTQESTANRPLPGPTTGAVVASARAAHESKSIGDINGDGISDLLLVDTEFPRPEFREVSIVFGGDSLPEQLTDAELTGSDGFRITGVPWASVSVGGGGDLNHDGVNDFVIASRYLGGSKGVAYVIFGSSTGFAASLDIRELDGENGFILRGADDANDGAGVTIGASVDVVEDFNGDGFDDLAIGAARTSSFSPNNSAVFLVYGSSAPFPAELSVTDLDGSNGVRINHADILMGHSVADAGDFNDDGITDLIMGGRIRQTSWTTILFGAKTHQSAEIDLASLAAGEFVSFEATASFTVEGQENVGSTVDGLGDVNGDGVDDVAVGNPLTDANGQREVGAAYVLYGSKLHQTLLQHDSLDGTNGFQISNNQSRDNLGTTVSGVGDRFVDLYVFGFGFDGFPLTPLPTNAQRWLLVSSSAVLGVERTVKARC